MVNAIDPDLYVVHLPRIDEVVPIDDLFNVTLEQRDEYNDWCNLRIREAIRAQSLAGHPGQVYTHYPFDTEESMDLVGLDSEGAVVIIDARGEPIPQVADPQRAGFNTPPEDWSDVMNHSDAGPDSVLSEEAGEVQE